MSGADELSDGGDAGDIVARIAAELAGGHTVEEIADRRGLPREFVEMAADRAVRRGLVRTVDLSGHLACGASICDPDPTSLLCAGCPFRPRPAAGRRQRA